MAHIANRRPVADDIAHAIERLTHVITNDRTDLPATVQRRHLLQDQKRLRPTRKPRCEILDWFNGVFEEARADAHRLRRAAETRDAQREKESQLVDEARRLLPGATAAHAPFADAVRHSSYERHNAQKNVWPVEGDLRSAGRFGRRSARQRLEEVTEALALANEHHIRVSERAQPTKKRLDRLEQIVYSWEDQASTRQILDEWYNLDRQARAAEIRVEALDTWHRWASGSSLGEGERHLLATEMTARIDPKIARLFELATPAPTIEAPRPATPAPAVDLRLP